MHFTDCAQKRRENHLTRAENGDIMSTIQRNGDVSKQTGNGFVLMRFFISQKTGGRKMYDVAIIGAGVVGAMIARSLSRYDVTVCVVDKEHDVAMGATKANSAIVHAGFDAECGTLKALLNVRGAKMMGALCEELGVKYRNNGSMVIGFDEEDRKTLQILLERGIQNGVEDLGIVEGKELTVKPEQAMVVTQILEAVYESAKQNKTIYFE